MSAFEPSSSPQNLNAYCAELDAALASGLIAEEQWYEKRKQATAEAYLSQENPRAQSGHGGDEGRQVAILFSYMHATCERLGAGSSKLAGTPYGRKVIGAERPKLE